MTGLCATCIHAKPMHNDRGSAFLLCLLSKTDPGYPKYPRLPVLRCEGFTPSSGPVGTPPAQSQH